MSSLSKESRITKLEGKRQDVLEKITKLELKIKSTRGIFNIEGGDVRNMKDQLNGLKRKFRFYDHKIKELKS